MKIKILPFLLLAFLSCFQVYSQNTVMIGDSVQLSIDGYKGGQIQWQVSTDSINWKDSVEAKSNSLSVQIQKNTYYRAKVTLDKCSYISSINSIKSFDFKDINETGDSIFSKTSQYIILIPDIQNYISDTNKKYLEKIMDWILQLYAVGFKTKAILQVGDVTNCNSVAEWEIAQNIFSKLNGKVDYLLCTGNHDYDGCGNPTDRNTTQISKYFNAKNYPKTIETLLPGNFENVCYKTSLYDQTLLIFSLEFGPRNKVVAWADSIAKANPTALGFVMTHAYLYRNQIRYNYALLKNQQDVNPHEYGLASIENVNDGEELWQKLISTNFNFRFVACGHMMLDYVGNLISQNSIGQNVLQMLFDTQSFPNGGNGWIQIMEFLKNSETVKIKTYSPVLKIWGTKSVEQYDFQYKSLK